jgi:hypothetical protein
MALSNIDKSHMEELLLSLNSHTNHGPNLLEVVKSSHADYSQLKLIAKQINMLRQEALDIINNSKEQNELHKIKTSLKLVSGNTYYLYEKKISKKDLKCNDIQLSNSEKYFSLISPEEWEKSQTVFSDIFLGQYFYDFDKKFIKC